MPFSFLFRDVIQFIFTTVIALCLFLPFFHESFNMNTFMAILLGGAVLGYVAQPRLGRLAPYLFRYIPMMGKKIAAHEETQRRTKSNWHALRVFYALPAEARDHIFLTQAYRDFFYMTGFYLGIYGCWNLIWLAGKILMTALNSKPCNFEQLAQTPVIGGHNLPTTFIIAAAWGLCICALEQYGNLMGELYDPGKQFDCFARELHKQQPELARSVWGRVEDTNGPVAATPVALRNMADGKRRQTQTNHTGDFQFLDLYDSCIGIHCELQVTHQGKAARQWFIIPQGAVPYLAVKIDEAKLEIKIS